MSPQFILSLIYLKKIGTVTFYPFTNMSVPSPQLYVDTIRTIVLEEDTSRPFISSSPSNGLQTEEEGFVAEQPWSTHYGDSMGFF